MRGRNIWQPKVKVMLAGKRFGFSQSSDRARHVSLSKLQASQKHTIRSESVNTLNLLGQLSALLSILLGGIQIVPLVMQKSQTKKRFTGNQLRRITGHPQDTLKGFCCQGELVVCGLNLTEIDCSRDAVDGTLKRFSE